MSGLIEEQTRDAVRDLASADDFVDVSASTAFDVEAELGAPHSVMVRPLETGNLTVTSKNGQNRTIAVTKDLPEPIRITHVLVSNAIAVRVYV